MTSVCCKYTRITYPAKLPKRISQQHNWLRPKSGLLLRTPFASQLHLSPLSLEEECRQFLLWCTLKWSLLHFRAGVCCLFYEIAKTTPYRVCPPRKEQAQAFFGEKISLLFLQLFKFLYIRVQAVCALMGRQPPGVHKDHFFNLTNLSVHLG